MEIRAHTSQEERHPESDEFYDKGKVTNAKYTTDSKFFKSNFPFFTKVKDPFFREKGRGVKADKEAAVTRKAHTAEDI